MEYLFDILNMIISLMINFGILAFIISKITGRKNKSNNKYKKQVLNNKQKNKVNRKDAKKQIKNLLNTQINKQLKKDTSIKNINSKVDENIDLFNYKEYENKINNTGKKEKINENEVKLEKENKKTLFSLADREINSISIKDKIKKQKSERLREALIMKEILDKPVALRRGEKRW